MTFICLNKVSKQLNIHLIVYNCKSKYFKHVVLILGGKDIKLFNCNEL